MVDRWGEVMEGFIAAVALVLILVWIVGYFGK